MEIESFLLQFLIILVSARLLGEIVSFLGAPSVIGELIAGILIGPSLLGWVEMNELIQIIAEIGVILLLFHIGLESDLDKLKNAGTRSIIVATGGFLAPFVAGTLAAYYLFDLSLTVSLFIGGTLTATSIGVTVRTLEDIGRHNSTEGQITLGAAVLDDIFGVILLALLYEFAISGEINFTNASRVILFIAVFFALAPILAKLISMIIKYVDQHVTNPGLIPVTMVSLVLLFAYLAHLFGAPELLGGFAAGIALSRRFFLPFGIAMQADESFSQRVEIKMRPIVHLFTPVFFVSIGMSMNLDSVDWTSSFFWLFSLVIVVIAIVTKFAGAFMIKEPYHSKMIIGMAMVPRGEVGLIFAGLGAAAGLFNDDIYTAMVMVIAYTTLLSPFWMKLYCKRYCHFLQD